jgi:AraC-like DNA-binding protein
MKMAKKKLKNNDTIITSVANESLTTMEKQEIARHTLDKKIGVCYGTNLNGNLCTVYAGWKKVSKGYRFHFTNYPFYRLVYTIGGIVTVNNYKKTYNAESGTIVSFSPGEDGELANNSETPWTHIYIHFTGLRAAKMYKDARLTSENVAILNEPLEIQQIFENIVCASIRQSEHSQTICDSYLRVLLMRLSELDLEHSSHFDASKITYLQCRNYINENFSNIVSIGEVAEKFYINKVHLCRLFKQYTDTTPMIYILQLKINRAAILLVETDYAVKKISFMMGFNDPYYFSKVFKKIYGVSPVLYRKHREIH